MSKHFTNIEPKKLNLNLLGAPQRCSNNIYFQHSHGVENIYLPIPLITQRNLIPIHFLLSLRFFFSRPPPYDATLQASLSSPSLSHTAPIGYLGEPAMSGPYLTSLPVRPSNLPSDALDASRQGLSLPCQASRRRGTGHGSPGQRHDSSMLTWCGH